MVLTQVKPQMVNPVRIQTVLGAVPVGTVNVGTNLTSMDLKVAMAKIRANIMNRIDVI